MKEADEEEKQQIEEEHDAPEEVTFISRFFLNPSELYKKEKYLVATMRISIFERILTKYLFQSTSKNFTLYPFLDNIKKDKVQLKFFNSILNYINDNFFEDFPLTFFVELAKELEQIMKEEDLKNIKFDKYIIKLEFLLAWHFENNFMTKQIDNKLGMEYYDNAQIIKGRTNYIYSIESLNTIFKFLDEFEKQSLSTRIDNEFPLIRNLFCSEKVYYFYCDKLTREKIPSGNIVKYLIDQINTIVESSKNSKIINYDSDNYYMMNLFLINWIIKYYPFYFHKKPELVDIYTGLKIFKNFPFPVGNLCEEVMTNVLNEIMFQGVSILNQLRNEFFLDMLDTSVNMLEVKYFRYTIIAYSHQWEMIHKDNINTENPKAFNLIKFFDRLIKKPKNLYRQRLSIRELVLKVLISIIINSRQIFTDETFKKLYEAFMPNYKDLYKGKIEVEKKPKNEEEEEDENDEEEDEEEKEEKKKNKKPVIKYVETQSQVKKSMDKLFKIIDTGLDKSINDFDKEINIIANKLASIGGDPLNIQDEYSMESILDNKGYLPIDSMRTFLKPYYCEKKIIYQVQDQEKKNTLDIIGSYLKAFTHVVKKYFKYFFTDEIEDNLIENNLQTLRKNFYNNFRIKILIMEHKNVINDLLDNIQVMLTPEEIAKKVTDEEFNTFWRFFVEKKEDIEPKYLIYIAPHYDSYENNPFRIINSDSNIDDDCTYLSEFIANNDYIYKSIIFMPFSSKCDDVFYQFLPNSQLISKNVMSFPTLDIMYSFLKKPLDYYIEDSNGILNLDVYKISVNEQNSKLFYKNVQFLNAGKECNCKITLQSVDYLGIEAKDEKVIELHGNFIINIFNLFFKKNVPFNFNMNSNNGWLEMFLDENYDKNTYDKFCKYNNFIETNNENKYYEELNNPENTIETRFKNFKFIKFTLETSSPNINIQYDDNIKYEYNNIKTDGNNKNFNIKFVIEPYLINGKKYCLPLATFTTI